MDHKIRPLFTKSIPIWIVILSITGSLFFGELIVRLVVNPGDFLFATLVDDPILGQRIKPNTTEHDALGFRNVEVPANANIIAIGDSQTYGVNAPRDGSWPYQLGELLHEPVYNMALGGFGPLQYLHLAENEALKLKPKQLIVGFYFGNDLIDAYRLPQHLPYWDSWREASTSESDEERAKQSVGAAPPKRFAVLRDWLARNSVLYSMLRVTLLSRMATWEQESAVTQMAPDSQVLWVDPSRDTVRTIFTPQSRLSALDIKEKTVQKGLQITKRALSALKKNADARGVKLLITLIPTKERVYYHYLKSTGMTIPSEFANLFDAEEETKKELILFLNQNMIEFVDVTKAMEAETFQHAQLYSKNSDGHPLALGYGVIARTVYDVARRQHSNK